MKKAIKDFPKQLKFEPKIENKNNLVLTKKFIVSGMGASHLAADLLKAWNPSFNLIVHHDYGLPAVPDKLEDYLIVISSYSGETEEAIDGFRTALSKKLSLACVSLGGKLLDLAEKYQKPYIKMPDTGIEPRSALGFSIVSLLKLMNQEKALSEIRKTADSFNMANLEKRGRDLAQRLNNFIPLIYTSTKNESIGYNWKIRFNETGKVPCFSNTFPELNHNEMVGFSREKDTRQLSNKFYFIFLKDKDDHPGIKKRMDILKDIYQEKDLPVEVIELKGKNVWEKLFSSLLLADWAAFYTAKQYQLKPKKTEIITKFKNILKKKNL